jgi:hypothetical protein
MTLSHPAAVLERLAQIEHDLEMRQNALEAAALAWFRVKRDKERQHAIEYLKASGTVSAREAIADEQTAMLGAHEEAEWEALKAVVRVLETRASIGQSILRSQGRQA